MEGCIGAAQPALAAACPNPPPGRPAFLLVALLAGAECGGGTARDDGAARPGRDAVWREATAGFRRRAGAQGGSRSYMGRHGWCPGREGRGAQGRPAPPSGRHGPGLPHRAGPRPSAPHGGWRRPSPRYRFALCRGEGDRGSAAPAAGPMTAGLVGSERVRRHPHRRARSAPQCGVSRGPRACRVRVPIKAGRRSQPIRRPPAPAPLPRRSWRTPDASPGDASRGGGRSPRCREASGHVPPQSPD